jgi:hypothetical protein
MEEKGFWHSLETQSARGQIPTVNSEMRIFTIAANAAFPSSFSNCLIVDRPRRQRGLEQGKVAFLSTAGGGLSEIRLDYNNSHYKAMGCAIEQFRTECF